MQRDVSFSALVNYFQAIAQEHKEIGHREGEKHFFRFEFDEVLTGQAELANFPAFILEGYRFSFQDERSDNPVKKRTGAFILADHIPDPGDYDYIHHIWDKLEAIADDILARMRHDKRKPGCPIRDYSLSSSEGALIATEYGNLYGIRVTFTLDSPFPTDVKPDRWLSQTSE
jgi:hypothetical protein